MSTNGPDCVATALSLSMIEAVGEEKEDGGCGGGMKLSANPKEDSRVPAPKGR